MTGIVAIGIPCLLRGGTEMQTLQLVKVLGEGEERANAEKLKTEMLKAEDGRRRTEDGGYGVTVVCYFESDAEVVAEFQAAGAEVRLLNLDRSLSAWRVVAALRRIFREERPDLIHVQYMAPGLLPIIAARLAGCRRVVATVHQPWTAAHHGWKARFLLRTAARLCTKFICVSEAAERSWFGNSMLYGPHASPQSHCRRHFTIHNALDLERIDSILQQTNALQLRQELRLEGVLVIGIVSRLTREKGVDILLKAFALLIEKLKTESGGRRTEGGGRRAEDGGHRALGNAEMPKAESRKQATEVGRRTAGGDTSGAALRDSQPTLPTLLIVGDGSERPALESQARALGLSQGTIEFPRSAFRSSAPSSVLRPPSSAVGVSASPPSAPPSPISAFQHFSVSAFPVPPPSRPSTINYQPSTILWAGKQHWERCIELLSIMEVTVVPSRFEGFGLTAAEAMACGKPVVASDAGGLPEVLGTEGSAGILFPAANAERLAEVLLGLAESPARRLELGRCARRRVEERFSFAQYQHRTQALYSELFAD